MAANLKKTVLIQYTRDFKAPITAGEVIGTLTYFPEGKAEVVYNLVASRAVNKRENAPLSVSEIKAQIAEDPNPLPPITVELVITHVLLPLAFLWLAFRLLHSVYRKRHRRHNSKAPRVKHVHLK